jgi:hypothetical protein
MRLARVVLAFSALAYGCVDVTFQGAAECVIDRPSPL